MRNLILPILLLFSLASHAQQWACKDPGDWTLTTSYKFERHSWVEKNVGIKYDSVVVSHCNSRAKIITVTGPNSKLVIPYAFVEDSASTGDQNYRAGWYVYHTPGYGNIIYKPLAKRLVIDYPHKKHHEYYIK